MNTNDNLFATKQRRSALGNGLPLIRSNPLHSTGYGKRPQEVIHKNANDPPRTTTARLRNDKRTTMGRSAPVRAHAKPYDIRPEVSNDLRCRQYVPL